MIQHNTVEWFGSNAELKHYFENDFKLNTIGLFKVPSSLGKRNTNISTGNLDLESLIGRLGNLMISIITTSPKAKVLRTIKWAWLEQDTRDLLKDAVCEMIQHSVLNKQTWEKLNASSIQTPNFTINSDTTNWLLTSDPIGQYARTAIINSGIGDYEWVEEDVLFTETINGNTKIIGKASLDTLKELSV